MISHLAGNYLPAVTLPIWKVGALVFDLIFQVHFSPASNPFALLLIDLFRLELSVDVATSGIEDAPQMVSFCLQA
jgi:hypothetical protein